MRVPLGWLKEYVDVSEEPARLAGDLSLCGLEVGGLERDGDDTVLDIDITTNRVDCMNVYGIAREVAVLYGRPLRPLELSFTEQGAPASDALRVDVQAGDLCGRFVGRVLDVRPGAAPEWMRRRLEQVGVRPISNVVDLTNYVMMEMGHPSHAFDLARIPGGRLVVRWADDGEELNTLDGQSRTLGPRCGVVAGAEGALALAGIMGGASSEVSEATRVVALEAAWWEPLAIRRAARALGMHTDASHRFERAADFDGPLVATARIAHLLQRIGAGSPRPGLIDVIPAARPRRRVHLRPARVSALLGVDVPAASGDRILRGLGFTPRASDGAGGTVEYEVPTWRNDVAREADLVEEIGRHFGLGRIPSALPPALTPGGLSATQARERALRRVLCGAGLQEVINYAFVPRALPAGESVVSAAGEPPALANPLSEEQGVLRTSLVFPGLLATLQSNLRQGRRDLHLFEIGRVFVPRPGGAPREQARLGLLLCGAAREHWSDRPRAYDFYDLTGLIEALFARLRLSPPELRREGLPDVLHGGRAAGVYHAGRALGFLGALAPAVARAYDCRDETLVAELDIDGLLEARPGPTRVRALERFPGVGRDLSLVCPAGTDAAGLEDAARAAAGELLRAVVFVDRYEGPPVPSGHYSLTLGLRYQHASRTLTGDEVQASVDAVAAALRARGIEIRGE